MVAAFYPPTIALLSLFYMPPAPATPSVANKSKTSAQPSASYEAALGELEALVASMESGQMPLDALLSNYQRGAVLLGFCRDKLAAVEDQIKVLDGASLKPWTQE